MLQTLHIDFINLKVTNNLCRWYCYKIQWKKTIVVHVVILILLPSPSPVLNSSAPYPNSCILFSCGIKLYILIKKGMVSEALFYSCEEKNLSCHWSEPKISCHWSEPKIYCHWSEPKISSLFHDVRNYGSH